MKAKVHVRILFVENTLLFIQNRAAAQEEVLYGGAPERNS